MIYRVIEHSPFDTEVQHLDFASLAEATAFVAEFNEDIQQGMEIRAIEGPEFDHDWNG